MSQTIFPQSRGNFMAVHTNSIVIHGDQKSPIAQAHPFELQAIAPNGPELNIQGGAPQL